MMKLQAAFFKAMTAFLMVIGLMLGANGHDTVSSFEASVNDLDFFENTMEDAVPQTTVYDLLRAHFLSPLPAGKSQKKAMLIGYDGCRLDLLGKRLGGDESAIAHLLETGATAQISYCGGANYPRWNRQLTATGPGWCSMLTGVWADKHRVFNNKQNKSNDTLTLLTTAVQDGMVDHSAFYASWEYHFTDKKSTYYLERRYTEDNGIPVRFQKGDNYAATARDVVADLSQPDCTDFIFCILDYTDHIGHATGFNVNDDRYVNAFRSVEREAREVLCALESRTTFAQEDWLVLITTDHGGYNLWHGFFTIQERMTFIISKYM